MIRSARKTVGRRTLPCGHLHEGEPRVSRKRAMCVRMGAAFLSAVMSVPLFAADFTMPDIAWKGHNTIGANFNTPQGPEVPWRITIRANESDRCYLPGNPIELNMTFEAADSADKAIELSGTLHWVWIGDEKFDETGGVRYTSLGVESELPLEKLTIEPGKQVTKTITRQAPSDRYGVLAMFLTTGEGVTKWITNVAILHPIAKQQMPDSLFFGDARGTRTWQRKIELATMAKLGVKWTRCGENIARIMAKPGEWDWKEFDEEIEVIREYGMLAMYLGGGVPKWMRSYGELPWPRPHTTKKDHTPSPDHYGNFAEFFTRLIERYKDTIRAVNVWNEPWEDGGISGWGGTGAHYRNLQRMAKLGVMRADPTVIVGGNDSDMNFVDNMLSDPSWQSYTDFITVHGVRGPAGAQVHRLVPDNVPIWNTEVWYTALTDRSVQWMAFEAARGVKKVNVVVLSNFFADGAVAGSYYRPKDPESVPDRVPQPNAVGYNTAAHMLEGMALPPEQLRPDALPYQFLFTRQHPSTPEATHQAVLLMFGQSIEVQSSPWWQLNAGSDARARVTLPEGVTGLFDKFGNPIDIGDDRTAVIPFNTQPVYVTADSVEPLRQVASTLEVLRYEKPLHIAVLDPTSPLDRGAEFTVRVFNPMPSGVVADVTLQVPDGYSLEPATFNTGSIASGGTFETKVKIAGPAKLAGGRLPLRIDVSTPLGSWHHSEMMQVRRIARFTPTMDGDLNDWIAAGVEPVVVKGSTGSDEIAAAMPWEVLTNSPDADAMGRWTMAYDDKFLYVAAQVRSAKRPDLPWDQTRDDWYELHPGGYAYKRSPGWAFSGENLQLALDVVENPEDYIYPPDDPRHRHYQMRRTDYLLGFYETRQGGTQAWIFRRPGSPFRHRYPFSPMKGIDQGVATGVKVVVVRDDDAGLTTYEVAIPLSLMPEIDASPGSTIAGAEVKLPYGRWNGIFSSQGRGANKVDFSAFQPYWMTGYSTEIPWKFE